MPVVDIWTLRYLAVQSRQREEEEEEEEQEDNG